MQYLLLALVSPSGVQAVGMGASVSDGCCGPYSSKDLETEINAHEFKSP